MTNIKYKGYRQFLDAKQQLKRSLRRLKYLQKKGQEFVLHKVRRKQLYYPVISAMEGFLMVIGKLDRKASENEIIDMLYEVEPHIGQYIASLKVSLFRETEDFELIYSSLDVYILKFETALDYLSYIEEKFLEPLIKSSPEPTL